MLQVNGCRYYTHTPTTSTPTHQASPLFIALSLSLSKLLPSSSSSSSSSLITMASSLQSLAFSSPVSHCPHQTRFLSGMAAGAVHRSARFPFSGQPLRLQRSCWAASRRSSQIPTLSIMMVKPTIQFIQGTDEQTIPDVKLTKSRDGTNGMAIFRFEQPSVFDSSSELGDITGFFMIDEEGVLQSVDVSAKFINGKPAAIEAKYVMRTPREWDRFMRFMERYANKNGLQFVKK